MPQNIVLFLEPAKEKSRIPLKIGRLYMNRFAIDESDANEIIGVFELKEAMLIPNHLSDFRFPNFNIMNYKNLDYSSINQIFRWNRELGTKRSEWETLNKSRAIG